MLASDLPPLLRALTDVPSGELVEIRETSTDTVPAPDGIPRFRVGEVIQLLGQGDGLVMVARADGARSEVPEAYAHCIRVRSFDLFERHDPPVDRPMSAGFGRPGAASERRSQQELPPRASWDRMRPSA